MKTELVTFFSVVLNLICMALGASAFACAAWILFDGTLLSRTSSDELLTVAAGMMAVGGVVVVISVIGCVAAVQKTRMLLLVYLGFLIVLVLGQTFILVLLVFSRNTIEGEVDETLVSLIEDYTGNNPNDTLIDEIQHYAQCCGSTGNSAWLENSYLQNQMDSNILPCSCFNESGVQYKKWCNRAETKGNLFPMGCTDKVKEWVFGTMVTIIAMDIGLMLIQIILFGIMGCLYYAMQRKGAFTKPNLAANDHEVFDPVPKYDPPYGRQNYGSMDDDDENHIDQAHPSQYRGGQNYGSMDDDDEDHIDQAHPSQYHGGQNYGSIDDDDEDHIDQAHPSQYRGGQNYGYKDADEDRIDQAHPSQYRGGQNYGYKDADEDRIDQAHPSQYRGGQNYGYKDADEDRIDQAHPSQYRGGQNYGYKDANEDRIDQAHPSQYRGGQNYGYKDADEDRIDQAHPSQYRGGQNYGYKDADEDRIDQAHPSQYRGGQNYGYTDADEDRIDQAHPSQYRDYQGPIDRF